MIYGYCRISTKKQKLERQVDNIKAEFPAAVIVTEEYTGTTCDRPKFNCLIKKVQPGDTIVFDEVSRMSRNAEDGFRLYEALYEKGVSLVFLKERHIDTDVFRKTLENGVKMTGTDVDRILKGVNEYLMILAKKQIEIAFRSAQNEVDRLHERTAEGVRKAAERWHREEAAGEEHLKALPGRKQGSTAETKKAAAVKEIIRKYSADFGGTLKDIDVMKIAGCARNSYYKYKRELKGE